MAWDVTTSKALRRNVTYKNITAALLIIFKCIFFSLLIEVITA